jgi:uncharacterized protein involved in exopolysaccharide biosynthesis
MFLLGAIGFAFLALVGACWWPVKYTAMAMFERRSDPASEDLVRGKSESFDTYKQVLQQELAGLSAINAAADDLEKTGMLPPLPRGSDQKLTPEGKRLRQQVVLDLRDGLKVDFVVRSPEVDLISVEFTGRDPRLAQALPNTLVARYMNTISEKMVANLTASRDFLQKKVDEADTRQAELTKKEAEFEIQHAGMLPEDPGTLQEEVERIDADMDRVRRQQSLAQQKLEQIKAFRAGSKAPRDNPPAASTKDKPEEKPAKKEATSPAALDKQLTEEGQLLEQETVEVIQELGRLLDQQQQYQRSLDEGRTLNRMTEKNPRMEALKKQIKDLDERIAKVRTRLADVQSRRSDYISRVKESLPDTARGSELVQSSPDPLLRRAFEMQMAQMAMDEAAAQLEVALTTNELGRLKDHQDELKKVLEDYVPKRQKYVEILRQVTNQQAEVDRWQKRLDEVQMALAAEAAKRRTHLSQVELAQEQFRPSSPQLLDVLVFALTGGLLVGGVLINLPIRLSRRERIALTCANVILLPALALALMNITLWLNDRGGFEEWRKAPVSFICGEAKGQLDPLKDRLLAD